MSVAHEFLNYMRAEIEEAKASTGKVPMLKILKSFAKTNRNAQTISAGISERWSMPVVIQANSVAMLLNGVVKQVPVSSFKSLIDSLVQVQSDVKAINLPYGCFAMNKTGSSLTLSCYYPGVSADIKFQPKGTSKATTFKVPLPNVIITYTLSEDASSGWKLDKVKYFCTDLRLSELPDQLIPTDFDESKGIFRLPLSNMYDDGKMCFGENTMPMRFTNSLRSLDYYYQIITIAPFNFDLGIRGLTKTYQVDEWYRYLSTLTEFPYQLLQR